MSQRTWSPDVVAIDDRIAALTVAQAALLNQYLADVHGVESTPTLEMVPDPQPDVIVHDGKAEPTAFDVVLDGFDGSKKIHIIKAVREHLGLGLREAKERVEAAPTIIKQGLPRDEAENLQTRLVAAGAKVSLKPSLS